MQNHVALSELLLLVRQAIDERLPLPVWVAAEISEIKVNRSGHCYMELVEKGGGGLPTAQARAVIWRSAHPRITAFFEAQTGQRLEAGIRILAKVSVSFHELYGFSLQITDIDPSYTLGEMELQRQQTIAQLQQEGVWDMNHELPTPTIIQHIAVISSASAAGYQDFCKELADSRYKIVHTLFEAFMQGEAAEESIISALDAVDKSSERFDAVIIIRGGGSVSDLNCFNTYRLCAHIAQFPLVVITGIGHDKDISIADMVAHKPLKTPTAVAGWLIEQMACVDANLDAAAQQLQSAVMTLAREHERRLERLSSDLRLCANDQLSHRRMSLQSYGEALPQAVEYLLSQHRMRLVSAEELTNSRSPSRILSLGFAVVRNHGIVVRSPHDIKYGDGLNIEVAEGIFNVEVK